MSKAATKRKPAKQTGAGKRKAPVTQRPRSPGAPLYARPVDELVRQMDGDVVIPTSLRKSIETQGDSNAGVIRERLAHVDRVNAQPVERAARGSSDPAQPATSTRSLLRAGIFIGLGLGLAIGVAIAYFGSMLTAVRF